MDQKINDLKPDIRSLSLNFRFSSRNSQSQQKLVKKINHFTIHFHSISLTYFTNLNSLNILKNIFPQHSEKTTHFTNFLAQMFLVGARKNIWTAPFLDAQRFHFRGTGKTYVSIFLYVFVIMFLFQRRRKLLFGGGLNNAFTVARCLGLVKCFKIFHLH